MKAPSPRKDQLRTCVRRSVVSIAALALMIVSIGVRGASAAPAAEPSGAMSPDAMAVLLATASAPAGSSCAEPSSSQLEVFPGSGSFMAMPPPPAAGDLWVQCSLPFSQGKPGGDCEGKHQIRWQVVSGTATKVTAELFGLDTLGNPLSQFVVLQNENVQMNSRLNPVDWKSKKGKGTYDIFAPVALVKITAEEADGDKATAYCTAIPRLDLIEPNGGVISESGGEAAIAFKAAIPRTDFADLKLYLDGVDVLPEIAALEGGLATCQYDDPCEGALASGVTYKDLIIDLASSVGVLASNTISGSFASLSCGGHVVRLTTDRANDFRQTTPQCNLDDLTEAANATIFDVNVTHIGEQEVFPNLITDHVPTEVDGNICAGARIISANVNGLQFDQATLDTQVITDLGTTPQGDHIGFKVELPIDVDLAQTDLRDDFDAVTTTLGTFHPGSNRLVAVATENSEGARAYDSHIFAVGNNIKPLAVSASATFVNEALLASTINAKVQSALQAKMDEVLSVQSTTELKNAFVLGLSAEGAQTIINSLCVDPLPGDGRTLGQIFKATVEDVLDNFTEAAPLTTFELDPPCSCDVDVKVYVEEVEADTDVACPLVFVDNEIQATLELPDVRVKVRAKGGPDECLVFFPPLPPLFIPIPPLPSSTEVNGWIQLGLSDVTFSYTITENDLLQNTTTLSTDPLNPPFKVGGEAQLAAGGEFAGNAAVEFGIGGDVCNFFLEAFLTIITGGQIDVGALLNLEIDIDEKLNLTEVLRPTSGGATALPLGEVRVQEQTVDPYHQEISGAIDSVLDIAITGPTQPVDPADPLSGAGITIGLTGQFATTKVDALSEGNPGFEASEPNLPTMQQMQDQGAVDATVGLSVDVVNSFFYSLAGGGDMKVPDSDAQGCFLGANVGAVLPANCDLLDIPGVTDFGLEAVATIRGICHGIRQNNCDGLSMADPAPDATNGDLTSLLTGTIRGVCHGAKPDAAPVNDTPCLNVAPADPDPVAGVTEVLTCFATELLSLQTITPASNVMFCAKGDIPVLRFPNNPAISGVTSDLAINDISVSLIVDRNGDAKVGEPGTLINDLPGCFSGLETSRDCNIVAACLDVNFRFAMENVTCDADPSIPGDIDKPGFRFAFLDFLPNIRKVGEVCAATDPPPSNDEKVVNETANDKTALTGPLAQNSAALSPPICGAGLDMGGLFTCGNTQVLGLEANGDTKYKEFLALTCDLQ
jgi:hypothetical protein